MIARNGRPGSGQRRLRVGVCLSLSGKYARFGRQAAQGLQVWQALDGAADLIIEDDQSDPRVLQTAMPQVAARSDVLLGPYSTQLMRTAGRFAAETNRLVWNHGGSGDDVEAAHPGHIVSVLTPASRYAQPFLHHLADGAKPGMLWIAHGKGSFGRQVASGADAMASALGISTVRIGPGDELPTADRQAAEWDLLCAGLFEEDVQTIRRARDLPYPPRSVCAVAAGVLEFGRTIDNPDGIYGIAQWTPGTGHIAELGPTEADFLLAYADATAGPPDYPAVQAAAGAVLAAHCARQAGGTTRELLWPLACELDTETLFGGFKIDPDSGVQFRHEASLVRWTSAGLSWQPAPTGAAYEDARQACATSGDAAADAWDATTGDSLGI